MDVRRDRDQPAPASAIMSIAGDVDSSVKRNAAALQAWRRMPKTEDKKTFDGRISDIALSLISETWLARGSKTARTAQDRAPRHDGNSGTNPSVADRGERGSHRGAPKGWWDTVRARNEGQWRMTEGARDLKVDETHGSESLKRGSPGCVFFLRGLSMNVGISISIKKYGNKQRRKDPRCIRKCIWDSS